MWASGDIDRRIRRTREAIQNALIELIEEKGFDAISITDITSRANINRGTFYLHYHDKADLLEKTEDELIEHIKDILIKTGGIDLEAYCVSDEPIPAMVTLFDYIGSRARLMYAILGLKANPDVQNRIKNAIAGNLFRIGFMANTRPEDLLVPGNYLISYVTAAHMGVVQSWLEGGCKESSEEMARILARLSFHGPFHAIRKAGESA